MAYTPIFYRLSGGFTERNVIKKGNGVLYN